MLVLEHARLAHIPLLIVGAPVNLPMCLLVETVLFLTQDAVSSWYCASEGIPLRPVGFALHAGLVRSIGAGSEGSGKMHCEVRMLFWQVQASLVNMVWGLVRVRTGGVHFSTPHNPVDREVRARLLTPGGYGRASLWE